MQKLLIYSLLFLISCGHFTSDGSRKLKNAEAPDFLKALVPKTGNIDDVSFYEKHKTEPMTYKVKYELDDFEISVTVDDKGNFIEKEEDLFFSSLNESLKQKITKYLSARFEKYQITETERRTDKNMNIFIDVEVASSDSKNPFLEISFDLEGNFVSEEVEYVESIEMLN